MIHSFDTEIAKKFGITSAVLLNNIYFWTEKNRANGVNIFDGRAWTYNSKRAFAELFPYLSARQIDYSLSKLKEAGVIITGNYNKEPYDQTLWYAVTDFGYSILQNCEMEGTKLLNGVHDIVQPIPYSKPDIKTTDSKPDIKKDADASADIDQEFDNLWSLYPKKQGKATAAKAYTKVRKKNPDIYKSVEDGIKRYVAYLKKNKTEYGYIKQGSTWFNQHCWEDDYSIGGNGYGQPERPERPDDKDSRWGKIGQTF